MSKKEWKANLINSTKRFIAKALGELASYTDVKVWSDIKFSKLNSGFSQRVSTRPDFNKLIHRAENSGRLIEIRRFGNYLSSNDEFNTLRRKIITETEIDWDWLSPHFVSLDLFREYLWLVNSLDYDEEAANRIATNFVNFIENPISDISFFSVIRGATTSFDSRSIIDKIKIKNLSLPEASKIIRRNDSLRTDDKVPLNSVVLEEQFKFDYGTFPANIFSTLSEKFDLIIKSLRLIKSGKVEQENIFWKWNKPGQLGNRELVRSGRARPRPAITNTYHLVEADIQKLEKFFRYLKSRSIPKPHQIALDRFNEASLRVKPEDVVIDLCIALEALLNDGPGGISYKLGMRATTLIGNTLKEKKYIVDLISDAYSKRSAFVHGGISKEAGKTGLSLEELSNELHKTYRKILHKAINHHIENHESINPQLLDELLLQ